MSDREGAYRVVELERGFSVVSADDRSVIECSGKPNAEHYATLLNQAYKRGYKEGYRTGKGTK